MKLRLISAILTALALFVAPLGMSGNGAMAHAVAATDMTGHCADMEQPDGDDRDPAMKIACMMACAAIPGSEPAPIDQASPVGMIAETFLPKMPNGVFPESETPPPRFS